MLATVHNNEGRLETKLNRKMKWHFIFFRKKRKKKKNLQYYSREDLIRVWISCEDLHPQLCAAVQVSWWLGIWRYNLYGTPCNHCGAINKKKLIQLRWNNMIVETKMLCKRLKTLQINFSFYNTSVPKLVQICGSLHNDVKWYYFNGIETIIQSIICK